MRRNLEYKRRLQQLTRAVLEFARHQDQLEDGNGCDGEAHTKTYRKMKRLAKTWKDET